MGTDNIVFEDLHGVEEHKDVTIDLDADTKDDGIQRSPDVQSAESVVVDDDDIKAGDIVPDSKSGDDDDSGDGASSASGDDEYSKNVKARIERERRAKLKERNRAEYWEQQAKDLAKRQYEYEKESLESTVEQADQGIERIRADLERAIEEGNTKEQVRLTDDLTNWKAKKARAEASLENLPSDGNVQPFDDKISSETQKGRKPADQWIEDRGDWYRQEGFEKATRLANRLDRELFKEGYDPETEEYFEELDRRIKAQMPDLYDEDAGLSADEDTEDRGERKRKRSPVAPVDGDTSRHRGRRGSKVQLGEADFDNMRRFGLDTNDPEVLKEYARNKREAEQRANR
jgi:hypothetical protein